MCDCRYTKKHLKSIQKLGKDDQEVANLLKEAQQQGLLDVYLVMVTHHEWLSVPPNRLGYPKVDRESDAEVERTNITCDHWRGLDGSKPDWEPQEQTLKLSDRNLILQESDQLTVSCLACSASQPSLTLML